MIRFQGPDGSVTGQFVIALPDGRLQTTSYTADHYNGFVASVEYKGKAVVTHTVHKAPLPHKSLYKSRPSKYKKLPLTPSPFVATNPYKSGLAFRQVEGEQNVEETVVDEVEGVKGRYRIY